MAACAAADGSTVWVRELGSGQRVYYMAPVRYWHWQGGNARPGEGGDPATYDVALAASRDGWKFSYLGERQPFARPTRDGSVGASRMWVRPPIRMGDEDFFFVTRGNMNEDAEVANTTDGTPKRLRGEVALGRLRVDGTVSIDGPYGRAGNLTTKALVFSGEKLRLNVDAGGGGAVTVSVRTPGGERLLGSSLPIVHSAVDSEVVWREGGLGHLAGQVVVLSFTIEEAKLFSFRFAHKSDDDDDATARKVCNIQDFGSVPGSPAAFDANLRAVHKAVSACREGGVLLVPAGRFCECTKRVCPLIQPALCDPVCCRPQISTLWRSSLSTTLRSDCRAELRLWPRTTQRPGHATRAAFVLPSTASKILVARRSCTSKTHKTSASPEMDSSP